MAKKVKMKPTHQAILFTALAATGSWAITPEQMLAANRYSDAQPNPSGVSLVQEPNSYGNKYLTGQQDFALFTATSYSFETKETLSVWKRLDLKTGEISIWPASPDISEGVFIGDTEILYINGTNEEGDGGISIYSADVSDLAGATFIASLPAPFYGLKAAKTDSGDVHFLLTAQAYPNGSAYNEALVETPASTARIYTSIFVRHWVGSHHTNLN